MRSILYFRQKGLSLFSLAKFRQKIGNGKKADKKQKYSFIMSLLEIFLLSSHRKKSKRQVLIKPPFLTLSIFYSNLPDVCIFTHLIICLLCIYYIYTIKINDFFVLWTCRRIISSDFLFICKIFP